MSDDAERKEKAARAKKLLAQRKKEKAKLAGTSSPAVATPSSPSTTAATVASARTSIDDSIRPSVDEAQPVIIPVNGDTTSQQIPLPVAASDETTATSPSDDKSTANLQETVSLLIAERTELQSAVSRLKSQLDLARGDSRLLEEGRDLTSRLEREKALLEEELSRLRGLEEGMTKGEEDAARMEKSLEELRNERDGLRTSMAELDEAERVKEEEARAKTVGLEQSLQRARERESGLEVELGRLRQVNTETSNELKKSESETRTLRLSSASADDTLSTLQTSHVALQSSHKALETELSELKNTHSALQAKYERLDSTYDSQTSQLAEAQASLRTFQDSSDTSTKAASSLRNDLAASEQRIESAEKRREALRQENGELVKQLEEVRGRVVEVMEEKVDLAGQVESWEVKGRGWEKRRLELESFWNGDTLSETSTRIQSLETALRTSTIRVEALSRELAELHAAYIQAQRDRDDALSSASTFSPRATRGQGIFLSPSEETPRDRRATLGRASGGPVDAILPASVRHKRQASLSALRARLQPRTPVKSLGEIIEGGEGEYFGDPGRNGDRSMMGGDQFGEEIVLCCPACEGEILEL